MTRLSEEARSGKSFVTAIPEVLQFMMISPAVVRCACVYGQPSAHTYRKKPMTYLHGLG